MTAKPDISVIVPTWNNLDMLRLCVRSIRKQSQVHVQIVIHVNGLSDGTLEWEAPAGRWQVIRFTHKQAPGLGQRRGRELSVDGASRAALSVAHCSA